MNRRSSSVLGLAAAAVLTLAACGGGDASEAPASEPAASEPAASSACAVSTDAGTVTAGMEGVAFAPNAITASVGDVIAWTNADTVPHTATVTDHPECTTDNLASGATGALTFTEPGTYAFFCKVHPAMTGTIEITG